MSERPSEVLVGPYLYTIVFKKTIHGEERRTLGATQVNRQRIQIVERQGAEQERDTVLHELLHACLDMMGLVDPLGEELEERVVTLLATALLGVLRSNPELVLYLTS